MAREFDAVEVGADLREARILLRRSLQEISRELRIRHVYLLAIEEGRLDDLPGLAYQTGFLRAYGNYLGFDGSELADRLKAARDATGERDQLQVFAPADEGHLPTRSVLLLAALLAVVVYGVWYFVSNTEGDPVERVAALPDRLASLLEGEPDAGSKPPAEPGSQTSRPEAPDGKEESGEESIETASATPERSIPRTEPRDEPSPAEATGETPADEPSNATPPPAEEGQAVTPPPVEDNRPAAPPAPEGTGAVAPAEILTTSLPPPARTVSEDGAPTRQQSAAVPSRVVLRATTDAWIEIRSDDASPVYSGLLREGQSYAVPERQKLTMVTGNAGGLDILVDGEAIPRLGPPGAVMRNIDLDPDSLRGRPDR